MPASAGRSFRRDLLSFQFADFLPETFHGSWAFPLFCARHSQNYGES